MLERTSRFVTAFALSLALLLAALAVWSGDSFGLLVFGSPALVGLCLALVAWDLRRDATRILAVQDR